MSEAKKIITVQQVMKTKVDFVDGLTTVSEALKNMQYIETKSLIVNKRDEHDEYGMVLISDIARKVLAEGKAPERTNIYEIMSKPVVCIRYSMDIKHAARLLQRFDLSRAPVVKRGKVIGVVSLTDMVLKGLCNK